MLAAPRLRRGPPKVKATSVKKDREGSRTQENKRQKEVPCA